MLNKFLISFLAFFLGSSSCYGGYPKLWNVPLQNENFVGRDKEASQIHKTFSRSKGFKYIVITGLAGIGKTQLAKHYCHKNYKNYEIVWWFDGSRDIPDQMKKFAEVWNSYFPSDQIPINALSSDNLVEFIKNKLRISPQKWFLVFDNVENKSSIEKYLPHRHGTEIGHVLITSKNATGWLSSISLTKFSRKDAKILLKKIIHSLSSDETNLLAETLDDYPLAVMQAAAFIKTNPSINPESYTKMYRKIGSQFMERMDLNMDKGNLLDNYENTAESAVRISLQKIENANHHAYDLLLLLAHLGSKEISDELLKSWVQLNQPQADYNFLINCLLEHSLIEVSTGASNGGKVTYTIHEIIQRVTKSYASADVRKRILESALKTFNAFLDFESDQLASYLVKNRAILFHTQKLVENSQSLAIATFDLLSIRIKLLECYLSGLRDYDLALAELESIEKLNRTLSFPSVLSEALYYINKGNYYSWKNADYESSIKFMKKGYELLLTIDGYESEKLRALTNLAQFEVLIGNVENASAYIKSGNQYLGAAKSKIYQTLFHYAKCLISIDLGLLDQALEENLLEEDLFKSIDDYPTLKFAQLIQKSEILLKTKRYQESFKVAQDVYTLSKRFFQTDDHTMPARSKVMLSLATAHLGNIDKALIFIKEAIVTFDKTYKNYAKHDNQAFAHKTLGDLLFLKEDYKAAFDEYEITREIYETIYKGKKIDDISALYRSLALVGIKLKDDYLAKKYFQKHLGSFGADHPRTVEIIQEMDRHKIFTS